MKKIIVILFLVFGVATAALSQQPANPPARPNVQGIRIEFITRHLKLTTEEAPFWSLFYEYSDELTKARNEEPDDIIATEERVLNVRKKYRVEFKKILLSDERVMKVFTIDREFNKILKEELDKRLKKNQQ